MLGEQPSGPGLQWDWISVSGGKNLENVALALRLHYTCMRVFHRLQPKTFAFLCLQNQYFSMTLWCMLQQNNSMLFWRWFITRLRACSVPELCSVLCSVLGSGSVFALQWWLSSVLDCRGSERLPGFSPVFSASHITTTRASSSFSSDCHFPRCSCSSCSSCFSCVSASSLGSAASTELALSMVRSARLPSWCTSLKTGGMLLRSKTDACRLMRTSIFLYSWGRLLDSSSVAVFYTAICFFF